MDLGIAGKTALVCAASEGLGRACAMSLAMNGALVTITGRTAEKLDRARKEIEAASGQAVTISVGDIAGEAGRADALNVCGEPDILVNNAGGPPPGDFRDWERNHWIKAIDANMLAPIELIKATVDGMMARGFGRIVNITSSAVKAPIEILGLSNGARSGLTGFVAGIARKTVRQGVTINNLLPGAFDTARLASTMSGAVKATGKPLERVREERQALIPAGRFGDPFEFGEYCAFLCSRQAGYITGQNLLIDGGNYPGTF